MDPDEVLWGLCTLALLVGITGSVMTVLWMTVLS
jgi:hypothetical protein